MYGRIYDRMHGRNSMVKIYGWIYDRIDSWIYGWRSIVTIYCGIYGWRSLVMIYCWIDGKICGWRSMVRIYSWIYSWIYECTTGFTVGDL
jgi:hypothetical protein